MAAATRHREPVRRVTAEELLRTEATGKGDVAERETLLIAAEARWLVVRPDNDFAWSGWADGAEAARDLDACIDTLLRHGKSARLATLFLPTGALQELSMSSGWGDELLCLAERFDRAQSTPDCGCLTAPFSHQAFTQRAIGTDPTAGRFAEVRIDDCRACERQFLHYAFEIEGISRSGRWVRAPLLASCSPPTAEEALAAMSLAPFHYLGGSYFDSPGRFVPRPFDAGSL